MRKSHKVTLVLFLAGFPQPFDVFVCLCAVQNTPSIIALVWQASHKDGGLGDVLYPIRSRGM